MHHCLCALSQMTVSFVRLVSGSKGHHPAACSVCACVCLCVGVPLASVALLSFSAAIWSTWNFFALIDVPLLLVYDTPRHDTCIRGAVLFVSCSTSETYVCRVCWRMCFGPIEQFASTSAPLLALSHGHSFSEMLPSKASTTVRFFKRGDSNVGGDFYCEQCTPTLAFFVIQGATVVPPFCFPIIQKLLSRL